MDIYFEKEISNRIAILDTLALKNDSLKIYASEIHKEVADMILMSRDVENLAAAVNRANAYFVNLSHEYGINSSDFTELNTGMNLNDIASVLRQNELNLFNQLIFKKSPTSVIPYTAQ